MRGAPLNVHRQGPSSLQAALAHLGRMQHHLPEHCEALEAAVDDVLRSANMHVGAVPAGMATSQSPRRAWWAEDQAVSECMHDPVKRVACSIQKRCWVTLHGVRKAACS